MKDPGLGPSGHITLTAQTWTQEKMCNNQQCPLFVSKHDTPCLPIHNVDISILLQWSTILQDLTLNASSAERITQMGVFICTLLSTSESNIGPGTPVHSMLKDATQMYRRHVEHQKMGMIMQSKMETLWLGDSNDLQEAEWMQLVGCGLKSSMQRMSQSFGAYANHWLHVHWSLHSPNSEHTLPGNSLQSESRMKHRRELSSTRLGWLNSIAGYEKISEEVKLEVSYLTPALALSGGGSPQVGNPYPPSDSRFGAQVHSLTSVCRTKKISCGIRAFPNGKNHMGAFPGKTCLLRRPLQFGRRH